MGKIVLVLLVLLGCEGGDMSSLSQRTNEQATRDGGGVRQKDVLVQILKQPSDVSQRVFNIGIRNPSRRLSLATEVWFEATSGGVLNYAGAGGTSKWDLYAEGEGINTGNPSLSIIEFQEDLPRIYEYDTAVRHIRVRTVLYAPDTLIPVAAAVPGIWYLRAKWEPNTPLDDKELTHLFSDCHVEQPVLEPP